MSNTCRYRPWHRPAAVTGLCLLVPLAGCLSAPVPKGSPTLREAERLEAAATAQRSLAAPGQSLADLGRALRLYALMDETAGAIRVHLNMAYLYEQQERYDEARRHASAALELAREQGSARNLYRALLAVGRLASDPGKFEQALTHARDPLERAVALTYLQRPAEAVALVRGLGEPEADRVGDLAFVFYSYARSSLDPQAANRALRLYKESDNYLGIAYALRLLARIAAERGDAAAARHYQSRARRVESALRDSPLGGSLPAGDAPP